jgi:hypothetical protein
VLLAAAGCGGDGQTDPSDVAEITLDATALILDAVGQTRQLTATTLDADGNTVDVAVEWTSDDPGIVTVEGDGLLVGQGPGTAEVTASVGTVSATATVSVNSVSALQVFDGNGQTAPAARRCPRHRRSGWWTLRTSPCRTYGSGSRPRPAAGRSPTSSRRPTPTASHE